MNRVVSTLTGPGSVALDHGNSLSLSWKVDAGWEWSATVDGRPNIAHSLTSTYAVSVTDGYGNTLSKSDLVLGPADQGDPESADEPDNTKLSGNDLTTFKAAKAQNSFPSFKATTSTTLLSTLATRAGITYSGMLEWYIGEEEVKGETFEAAIARLCEVSATDRVIGTDGAVTCSLWEASASSLAFEWENLRRHRDNTKIYTGLQTGKRSSIPAGNEQKYEFDHADSYVQPLTAPMISPAAVETDLLGAIAAVAFFDGDPGSGGGLLAFLSFDTDYVNTDPATGTEPATHMTVVCKDIGLPYPVKAILKVTGTPYGEEGLPSGVDLAFLYPPSNADPEDPESYNSALGAWPSTKSLIDPLFPGSAWAAARYPYILAKENGPGDYLEMNGVLDVSVRPLQHFDYDVLNEAGETITATYKVMEITHDIGSVTTSLVLWRVA